MAAPTGSGSIGDIEEPPVETQHLLSEQQLSGTNVNNSNSGNSHQPVNSNNNNNRMKAVMVRTWNCLRGKLICFSRVLSLTEKSSATSVAFMANAAVMGIVTLNVYSASYFLAWKKEGSTCHVFTDPTNCDEINSLIRFIVVGLPFAGLALSLCIGSLAEAAKDETRYLGCAACLVLIEIVYVFLLGAVMTTCMSDVSGWSVFFVTLALVGLLLQLWGCCCRHPKLLRYILLWKCCCLDIVEEQAAQGMNEE